MMTFTALYSSPARAGRIALTALCFTVAGAALTTLPMIGTALADHGEGGGHDNGGHDGAGGSDHSGSGRGAQSHDNSGPGHDDAAEHDANDDHGGLAGGGADDPADHDVNDDNGTDGAVIQPTTPTAN